MAKKQIRFKEAELLDQNQATEAAVPATDTEVAQATDAAPATAEDTSVQVPAEETADDAAVEGAEGEVQEDPETVSVEVQIPTSELAAAVAQATGDLEAANVSPDTQQAAEDELVATEGAGDVPVEASAEEGAGAEVPAADEGQVLESQECGKDDKLTEEENAGAIAAAADEKHTDEIIGHAIDIAEESALHESEEAEEVAEDVEGDGEEDAAAYDAGLAAGPNGDLPPGMAGEDDLIGVEDLDFTSDALEADSPAVQDFLSKIDSYLADEDAEPAQVADALRTSADFFDALAPEGEEDEDVEDEDGEGIEDISDYEGDIPLDFDAIDEDENFGENKGGDEFGGYLDELKKEAKENSFGLRFREEYEDDGADDVESDVEDSEGEISECVSRVPCKFPKKNVVREANVTREPRLKRVEKKEEPLVKVQESEVDDSAIYYPAGSDPRQEVEDFVEEAPEFEDEIGYDDTDMVQEYESLVQSRRNAIRNFRESAIRRDDSNKSVNRSRFNEALRTSVRFSERGDSGNPNSWSNNRFIDKYEESEKLDFKKLLNEGFLG